MFTHCYQRLQGPVGLFLTSHPVEDTIEWFQTWSKPEYARLDAIATRVIDLPAGTSASPRNSIRIKRD